MKKGLYSRLALLGISKNRKTYLPYLLTCIGMIMMFYIVSFLSLDETVREMKGGSSMQMLLGIGTWVIGIFSLIFLFYTHSFLIRRRKKEFGLYNILGMGKGNLTRILLWETLFLAIVSIGGGLFCGILFSKVAELGMCKLLGQETSFNFSISFPSIRQTALLFLVIFALILLNTLRQIHVASPVELMRSEAVGEKPPRANWALAIIGALLLAGAYFISVTITNPMTATMLFFVAASMVIIGTYLLFITGSVAFCKLLQKNKRYYYKTSHFISVSSMVYRMKRNGAGLASICILSTMVLVMLSSTFCLYLGQENSSTVRFPRDVTVRVLATDADGKENLPIIKDLWAETFQKFDAKPQQELEYRALSFAAYEQEDEFILDENLITEDQMVDYGKLRNLVLVSLDEFNRAEGVSETLEPGQILLFSYREKYNYDEFKLQDCETLQIKPSTVTPKAISENIADIVSTYIVVMPDWETITKTNALQKSIYENHSSSVQQFYGFNLEVSADTEIEMLEHFQNLAGSYQEKNGYFALRADSVESARHDFYALYGGMFFIGILLTLVFVLGAVLLMYYKQITEGYEDQARFNILQKVGMTDREIKQSVHSQILTVFFLPLLAAGMHIAFAFPIIQKLLLLFQLYNIGLLIAVTVGCYLLFSLCYVLAYSMTSRVYYNLVRTPTA